MNILLNNNTSFGSFISYLLSKTIRTNRLKVTLLSIFLFFSIFTVNAAFKIHYSGSSSTYMQYCIIQGTNAFDVRLDTISGSESFTVSSSNGTALTAAVVNVGGKKYIRISGLANYSTYSGNSRTITLTQSGGASTTFRLYVVTSTSTSDERIQLSKTEWVIPTGTTKFIIPYKNINRGMANADVSVSGSTGITAHFDRDSLALIFSINETSPIYSTIGQYSLTLGGGIGALTLNVIRRPTMGTIKFSETFGTVPETWSDYKYGNSACSPPTKYDYYRGQLQSSRGAVGSNYEFLGYNSLPSCGTVSTSLADGQYLLSARPGTARTDAAWFGQDNNASQQNAYDHTGDVDGSNYRNGLMLVVNAALTPGVFYKRQVNGLCNSTDFTFSFWLANILSPSGTSQNIPINVQYEIWENDPGENFTATQANSFVQGNTYNGQKLLYIGYTGDIPGYYSDYMIWRNYKLYCTMPETRDNVFVVLRNRASGGGGNDLAIDDIQFQIYAPLVGISSSVEYGDPALNGKIRIKAKIEGDLQAQYYYRWQRSDKDSENWINMDSDPFLISSKVNANGELYNDYDFNSDYANSKFRLVVAKEKSAFDNPSCSLVLTTCTSNIPYARITAPVSVCSEATYADFMLEVSFFGTMINNEWKFNYKKSNGEVVSVTVTDSTHYYIPQRITSTANYVLVSSETGGKETLLNQAFSVEFNPEAIFAGNVRIVGSSEVCIYQDYYTYSIASDIPLPRSTIYSWSVGSGNQIIGDSSSSSVKIKFNTLNPVTVNITAYSPCRDTDVTVQRTISTTTKGPKATTTTTLPDICVCSSCGDYSLRLLEVEESDGASSYYWDWDASYNSYFEYYDEDQVSEVTGRYLNKIIIRVKNNITSDVSCTVRVTANNECGGTTQNVTFNILKKDPKAFALSYSSVNICSSELFDLTSIPKSVSDLTYSYYTDALGLYPVTDPKNVSSGTYYVKGTETGGCFSVQPFSITATNLTVNLPVTYDASCNECPVKITISSPQSDTDIYYLFSKIEETDISKAHVFTQINATSKQVTFNGKAGEFDYYIKKKRVCLSLPSEAQTITIYVAPSYAIWSANQDVYNDESWTNAFNWNSEGSPIWCTDVVVPSGQAIYPVLVDGDACRDVTLKSGASIGQIQRLLYRKAFVELVPDRNRWYTLSPPLRYMYSADYHADMSWANAISPKIFMMYFNAKNSTNPDGRIGYVIGDFSKPFSKLEEPVSAADGFALWINGKGNNLNYDDSNFPTGTPYSFPRHLSDGSDVSYSYHDQTTGEWLNAVDNLDRGSVSDIPSDEVWVNSHNSLTDQQKNNRYRFVFEGYSATGAFDKSVNAGTTNILGNPYLSHIDFTKFVEDNVDNIYSYYRIWDGNMFYSYIVGGGSESWSALNGLSTEVSNTLSQYISPMQSFFIETKPGRSYVSFKPENISVTTGATGTQLRSGDASKTNVLRINLSFNEIKSQTILAIKDGAVEKYKQGEDIKKMFSPRSDLSEIYTISSDTEALEVNLVDNSKNEIEIPIGIKSANIGSATLTIDGASNVYAYKNIILEDRLLSKSYNLRDVSVIEFEKSSGSNLENRFFIRLDTNSNSIEDNWASNIFVTVKDGIQIKSDNEPITEVNIYDATGHLVFHKNQINNTSYYISKKPWVGLHIINVETTLSSKVLKIIL